MEVSEDDLALIVEYVHSAESCYCDEYHTADSWLECPSPGHEVAAIILNRCHRASQT